VGDQARKKQEEYITFTTFAVPLLGLVFDPDDGGIAFPNRRQASTKLQQCHIPENSTVYKLQPREHQISYTNWGSDFCHLKVFH
jgi:hypothetical protein